MITLTTPIAPPTVNTVDPGVVSIDVATGTVTYFCSETDASGAVVQVRFSMTGAAFLSAVQAASGSLRVRLHTVLQGLVPSFAGSVT